VNIFTAPLVAAPLVHLSEGSLGGDHHAAQVEVDHPIHFLQRGLLERLGNSGAGIVHQHIETAERRDRLADRGCNSFGIRGVRTDRDRPPAGELYVVHHRSGRFLAFGVSDRNVRAVGRQPLGDRGADAA
jgi:hypothetical protein